MIPITITHLGAETCVTGSGHILGSCFIQFSFPEPDGTPYRVTFSGDLGCHDSPLGIRITRLYQDMDDCWDREAKT